MPVARSTGSAVRSGSTRERLAFHRARLPSRRLGREPARRQPAGLMRHRLDARPTPYRSSLPHFLDALLAGDRLARALPGPRVGPGPLAADRQPLAVPQTPIAADVAQPGDALLDLAAELAFHRVFVVQQRGQLGQLVLGQVASPLDPGRSPFARKAPRPGTGRSRRCIAARSLCACRWGCRHREYEASVRSPWFISARHREFARLAEPASAGQPCRCLWRGLVQITYTLPWRRTILQFSQIRLTLDRTFMVSQSL